MLTDPSSKYRPFPPVALTDRRWPNRTISQAAMWMSTDLRDGNQALFEPMNVERKLRLFRTLSGIGFKEIGVALAIQPGNLHRHRAGFRRRVLRCGQRRLGREAGQQDYREFAVVGGNGDADQIEWMHRHIARRDSVILSVHTHNDRGTALAAVERVEGCLFGNANAPATWIW